MSRSIPTLTIPPGHPRAFAQKKFSAPGHLTINYVPAPGHLTNPGIFKICTVFTVKEHATCITVVSAFRLRYFWKNISEFEHGRSRYFWFPISASKHGLRKLESRNTAIRRRRSSEEVLHGRTKYWHLIYTFLKFAHICCCSSSYCGVPAFKLIHVLSL